MEQEYEAGTQPSEPNIEGAKVVSSAVVGLDYRVVVVNAKTYIIHPPTIARISGAAFYLCEFGSADTVRDLLRSLPNTENLTKALSWLIQGDDALSEELAQAVPEEVISAIEAAFSMIGAENFIKLSALQKSVSLLIAKPK